MDFNRASVNPEKWTSIRLQSILGWRGSWGADVIEGEPKEHILEIHALLGHQEEHILLVVPGLVVDIKGAIIEEAA